MPHRAYLSSVPYVGLTAAAYRVFPGQPKAMLGVQVVLAVATVLVVMALAHRLSGGRAALLAGLVTALHPGLVYYDVRKLHPLGLDTLLSVAPLLLLPAARTSIRRAALVGVVLGLGVLERGSLVPFALFAVLWIARRGDAPPGRFARAATALGAIVLVLAPWLARNARVLGRPVLITGNGYRFFLGNVPPSQGSALLPSGEPVITAAPDVLAALPHLDESGQDRLLWALGLAFVREHPKAAAVQFARKAIYFWTFTPQTGSLYPRLYRVVYLVFYAVLSAAAALGVRRLARGPTEALRTLWLMAALGASVTLAHAIFYVELRHRWAMEPLLAVLASSLVAAERPSRDQQAAIT